MAKARVEFSVMFLLKFLITLLHPSILFALRTSPFAQDLSYLKLVYNATESLAEEEYDYIVVGGGTAGCSLASTLSVNYSVLLLERGGVAFQNPNVNREEGVAANTLEANDRDSPAQTFTSEDGVLNVRGRVLGGTSMINFGFYSRADHDFYADSGIEWDMNIVRKAYEWVEESLVSLPILNSWQSSVRRALLQSGIRPNNGFSLDHLLGTKTSGSTFDQNGTRHGAVELLNKANNKNLRVVIHATVQKLVFGPNRTSGLSATGVIYGDTNGNTHIARIRGKGEIFLSAGTLGSTQLLLLSGVGPRSYLASLNIPLVYDQPLVGQFMADNPRNQINILPPFQFADFGARVVGITKSFYIQSTSGILPFFSPASAILFPGPSSPLNLTVLTIVEKVSRPVSKGSLRLASPTNASISPIVRFNYFSDKRDLITCANAMRSIGAILRTREMQQYRATDRFGRKYFQFVGRALPDNLFDEQEMENFCRSTLSTLYHFHGGCVVNKVVDRHLKVIGINALRVVDASTFVASPGTNPQATLMMFGRYVGLRTLDERKTVK